MKDRHKLNLFHPGEEEFKQCLNAQEITNDVLSANGLQISMMAMDFPAETTLKYRKELENNWINILPQLNLVTSLSCRHKVDQRFFEAVCRMKNIKHLHFWTSTVEDISSISKLTELQHLDMENFSRLKDITPILKLKNLQLLSISNSFKIENYSLIGKIIGLEGLRLSGNTLTPKNLRLPSLKPLSKLKQLKHLDLTNLSVIDNSYEVILEWENLERFDISAGIPLQIRNLIKASHKKLAAGFFMDWDFDNNMFYPGKEW